MTKTQIQAIVAAANLEQLARGCYGLKLKGSGNTLKCLTPFGAEKTPSFTIYVNQNRYKCFSTGKHGDVIEFVMEMERISFVEAVKFIADYFNIEISETTEMSEAQKRKEKLYASSNRICNKFRKALQQEPEPLEYCRDRFGDEMIDKFALGYHIPPAGKLVELKDLGMLSEKGFELTSNRVIFPVRSVNGNVISFTGRRIDGIKKTKYINTKNTEIYDKSSALYGLYESRQNIMREGWGMFVEGNPDVIGSHMYGKGNALCAMGTSFTEDHARNMIRYSDKWVLALDGDKAGVKAAVKFAKILLKFGAAFRTWSPGPGDPYDWFKQGMTIDYGSAEDFFDWYIRIIGMDQTLYDLAVLYIENIEDLFRRHIECRSLISKFGIGFSHPEKPMPLEKIDNKNILNQWQQTLNHSMI